MTASQTHPFPRLQRVWPVVQVIAMYAVMRIIGTETTRPALALGTLWGVGSVMGSWMDYMLLKDPKPPMQLLYPVMAPWGAAIALTGFAFLWFLPDPHRFLGAAMATFGATYIAFGLVATARQRRP